VAAPKPYFDDGDVAIYHGDCTEIAPSLGAFNLLCTDPPYGIKAARKAARSGVKSARSGSQIYKLTARDYGESSWDDEPPPRALLEKLRATSRWQCIFGGNYFELPPQKGWLVWDKLNDGTKFADVELAWTNYDVAARLKRHEWNGMHRGGVAGRAAEPRFHPTQKPIAVMSWAIGLCPERPTTVFDPFMGSGTTLRACKDLGIRCVGIEREEKYCEIAAKRLSQQTLALGSGT
jgi:site-specific DNA-methyltransferase (adenine-specific)